MEGEAGEMLLILGGTVLIVVYGIRVRKVRRRLARHPPKGSPAHRRQIRRAFEAEFGLEAGELDRLETAAREAAEQGIPFHPPPALEAFSPVFDLLPREDDAFGVVVCPECGERFHAGIAYCERCGVATVDEDEVPEWNPNHPSSRSDRPSDRFRAPLVCVFTTTDVFEAAVVRSILECHDIPTTTNGPMAINVHVFYRNAASAIRLMVLEPDAEQARRVIASAR